MKEHIEKIKWINADAKEAYTLLFELAGEVDGYSESHHILPRALGGSDHESNLIELLPEDHLLAHYWLYVGTRHTKMAAAYHGMAMRVGITNKRKPTPDEIKAFGDAQRDHSKHKSELMKAKCADPKHHFHSDEIKQASSERAKAFWADPEKRKKQSEKMRGSNSPFWGKNGADSSNANPVIDLENNIIFMTGKDAEEAHRLKPGGMTMRIKRGNFNGQFKNLTDHLGVSREEAVQVASEDSRLWDGVTSYEIKVPNRRRAVINISVSGERRKFSSVSDAARSEGISNPAMQERIKHGYAADTGSWHYEDDLPDAA